ncbi:MAG: thiamine phosphate synthase [Rhodobacteraceae bacterium]|nr:MAG: thiamine phosphate synthase [Paracoccaceae bacterium]
MIGPIYAITDPDAPLCVAEQARAAARGGAWAVQIRDKRASDAALAALVAALLPEMTALGVKLIVNDRTTVAVETGAHGLHIGQGDGDPVAIRARIGPEMMLGLSVETEAHAARTPPGVDYVGAGPVRATASKPDHATPIGFDGLARLVRVAPAPAVAIGGLGLGDAAAVKGAGAAGMAVVSAISRAPDPEAATRALVDAWRRA